MRKKITSIFCGIFISSFANAGGWIEAAVNNGDTHHYSGWACNPAIPGEISAVHIWADGVFLGAIATDIPREQAVANACGGTNVHGFSGSVNIPANMKTWTNRNVSITYVGAANVAIPNSPVSVYFGNGPRPVPRTVTVNRCMDEPAPPAANWILTQRVPTGACRTVYTDSWNFYQVHGFYETWTYDPDIPAYYEMVACENPYPLHMNWTVISSSPFSSACKINATNPTYGTEYKIRKLP